ncbi:hypothetical protein D3C72_1440440 [compost metagenome]
MTAGAAAANVAPRQGPTASARTRSGPAGCASAGTTQSSADHRGRCHTPRRSPADARAPNGHPPQRRQTSGRARAGPAPGRPSRSDAARRPAPSAGCRRADRCGTGTVRGLRPATHDAVLRHAGEVLRCAAAVAATTPGMHCRIDPAPAPALRAPATTHPPYRPPRFQAAASAMPGAALAESRPHAGAAAPRPACAIARGSAVPRSPIALRYRGTT